MNAKRIIKGIAKTTGKYTLKTLGKGIELTGRETVKMVDALVKNPQIQKIVTSTGLLAASVMIPGVGVGILGTLGLKYLIDKSLLGKDKGIISEINDILRMGNGVTKNVSDKVLSPTLNKLDKGIGKVGKKYQSKIDDIFK